MTFTMKPVAFVRGPHSDTASIPKGLGAKHEAEGIVEVLPEFEEGLTDIDGFSHLYLIWIFDRGGKGDSLITHPPIDNLPHGVFATRMPNRPNAIGLTVVELLERDGRKLRVKGVDMLDGTPVVDIKPYLSNVPGEIRRGWIAEAEQLKLRTKNEE